MVTFFCLELVKAFVWTSVTFNILGFHDYTFSYIDSVPFAHVVITLIVIQIQIHIQLQIQIQSKIQIQIQIQKKSYLNTNTIKDH